MLRPRSTRRAPVHLVCRTRVTRTHSNYLSAAMLTQTDGQDPSSAHRRCMPQDITSAEPAHRRGMDSADSADAGSGQVSAAETDAYERNIVPPPPLTGVSVPGRARRALGCRCGSIGASCRCSRTLRRCLLSSHTESARAEGHTYAGSVPLAKGVWKHGQRLLSGGPGCAYVHPARADCVYMPGRQSSRRAVRYGC